MQNAFMGNLDYVGFNMVSAWAPLGEVGPCSDTWSAAYQMNAMKDGDYCSQGWPGTVPHQLFAMFQATFAIITPVLIIGGLIDRIKFSALIIFVLLWGTFVYDPIAHWVWGGGYIGGGGLDLDPDLSPSYALDFAGGTVVHITSGFSALAGALDPWQKTWIWQSSNGTTQYSNGCTWCRNTLVWMVWFQRRK